MLRIRNMPNQQNIGKWATIEELHNVIDSMLKNKNKNKMKI